VTEGSSWPEIRIQARPKRSLVMCADSPLNNFEFTSFLHLSTRKLNGWPLFSSSALWNTDGSVLGFLFILPVVPRVKFAKTTGVSDVRRFLVTARSSRPLVPPTAVESIWAKKSAARTGRREQSVISFKVVIVLYVPSSDYFSVPVFYDDTIINFIIK
jgi:hypothetical protein